MGFPAEYEEEYEGFFKFQSLIGFYGFSGTFNSLAAFSLDLFQSLIGFYGFSGLLKLLEDCELLVSIPDRVLWVFRPVTLKNAISCLLFQSLIGFYGFSGKIQIAGKLSANSVSIPDRVLWVFRL